MVYQISKDIEKYNIYIKICRRNDNQLLKLIHQTLIILYSFQNTIRTFK
jgi:hypothetical protein